MKSKMRVIYIAGSGHSGSTLMNYLLGSSENAIAVSELKAIKYYIE